MITPAYYNPRPIRAYSNPCRAAGPSANYDACTVTPVVIIAAGYNSGNLLDIIWMQTGSVTKTKRPCFDRRTQLTAPNHSIPRFAWGKYFREGGALKMPLSMQAHHGLVDGLHFGRFYELVQALLDDPASALGAP
jgi:hypothetical protein